MPGGDRTGPSGAGPMTGRGVGICAGYDVPGYMNPAFGRGVGRGWGRGFGRGSGMGGGRGWRHQYYATGLPGWVRGGGYAYPSYYPGGREFVPPGVGAIPEEARNEELAHLKEQARYFKDALNDIETRVDELQKQTVKATETREEKKGQ
ncbi:MAG: DUF5320 domain-containing protein [candidate division Zixibacteria bacterium]|nr:DUF5320 domain-containing protein [candidate division Zixibacteria bacterium]